MKVIKKQTNSKMCIICGMENPSGLQAPFYEIEDGSVVSIFKFKDIHQSYPERTHGGLICAMLDEVVGRSLWTVEPEQWGVTTNLTMKYRKPVPYNTELYAVGKIIDNKSRTFKGIGKILDKDGNVLAEAEVIYIKLPLYKISENNHEDVNIYYPDDVKEINI